ncbi:alkaline phosphatase D family protein [Rhizohabitans arisaemae]|uniref:alkaline phosphatase D family protein n=1 Tax=Rhizohabitans arisaemae TaxID=2720610 RepID=UPI0024B1717C|nr:alkaline phosphatase D family protein [Rhizohabitans arisaemae]
MPELVVGPLLRYADETSATVWVETSEPGTVRVLDRAAETFSAHGHHYALVEIDGLAPGARLPYTVSLNGETVWPLTADGPPSMIRTIDPAKPYRVVFGSCRAAEAPTVGSDVLRIYADRLAAKPEEEWPDTLLMLGDQVYADEVDDFEGYAELYRAAWTEPLVRWLLSTIPTAMILDDHDLCDDWNTSQAWRDAMQSRPGWQDKVKAGLGSYWIYQHLGNLAKPDAVLTGIREGGGAYLDEFAVRADQEPTSYSWSYSRDIGGTRLIVLDSRCSRALEPGRRAILDEVEWAWFESQAVGGMEHLLIATSLPVFLPYGVHYGEAWNEAVCAGVWGKRWARFGERIRQAVDLEHWAAFRSSFVAMSRIVREIALGRRGTPPSSVLFLSGDVHFSYVARLKLPGRVAQIVCSPMRNPLPNALKWINRVAAVIGSGWLTRGLAKSAKVSSAPVRWRIEDDLNFTNSLGRLELSGDSATLRWFPDRPANPNKSLSRYRRKPIVVGPE